MDKQEFITKAEADAAVAKAVAEALAKAEEDKKEYMSKADAKVEEATKAKEDAEGKADAAIKSKEEAEAKAEAAIKKEKEVRYEVYQEVLAYRRRKIPCRNYVPRYAGWRRR